MKKQGKVLALDFDGVICDSLDECLLTAYNAYQKERGVLSFLDSVNDIDMKLRNAFQRWRYLVRPAGEYGLLLDVLLHGEPTLLPQNFEERRQSEVARIAKFERLFFQTRRELRQRSLEKWSGLHRLYSEFREYWPSVKKGFEQHYIVTTKDMTSVLYFNDKWRLGFKREHIFTKDNSAAKANSVACIASENGIGCESVVFVDDHPDHLSDVAPTNAVCCWAAWGYTPREKIQSYPQFKQLNSLEDLLN